MNQHYARKRRQLAHAAKCAQRAIERANGKVTQQAERLLLKVHRMVAELKHLCSTRAIKRALGGLLFLGATTVQANAQNFGPVQPNSFGLVTQSAETVGFTNIELADLDGDGDLDFIGLELPLESYGYGVNIVLQENEGSPSAAAFGPIQSNPFGFDAANLNFEEWDVSQGVTGIDFDVVDLDQDGDLDVVGSFQYAYFYNYNPESYAYLANAMFWVENTGTSVSPQFGAMALNPFGLDLSAFIGSKDSELSAYAFDCADIDGDGDLDFLGTLTDYTGDVPFHEMYWCENTGSAMNPLFAAPVLEPFGLLPSSDGVQYPGLSFSLEAVDLDGDGDLDLFQSLYFDGPVSANSVCQYFENTGSASEPSFAASVNNPFGLLAGISLPNNNLGVRAIEFSDIDGDGDLDFFANDIFGYGAYEGYVMEFQENISPVEISEVDAPSFELYPNPATTTIRFNWGELEVLTATIVDASGAQVMQCNPTRSETDIQHLDNGLYLLSVDTEAGRFTRRFIKK
jgi:hypothetical protein